jgi:hypothetical protein
MTGHPAACASTMPMPKSSSAAQTKSARFVQQLGDFFIRLKTQQPNI